MRIIAIKRITLVANLLMLVTAVRAQYTNPVLNKDMPDPSVVRAPDGQFYVYATEGGGLCVPIYKSRDLATRWRFAGSAFNSSTRPTFIKGGSIWAPDINYINGQFVLYYSMAEWGKEWNCGIGVATSSSPRGGFVDKGKLFTSTEIGVQNSIDPCFFQDDDGKKYLFWGSFRGVWGIELSADGLSLKPGAEKFQIGPNHNWMHHGTEATMIVKHDGYYYFMGSLGNCCEGANSTYRVVVSRSKELRGPYVNKRGKKIMDVGGSYESVLSGNELVAGPGHCSQLIIDDNGDYWMLYHGFDKKDIDAGRKLFVDKVLWDSDGWPYIEGKHPSKGGATPFFKDDTSSGIADVDATPDTYTVACGGDNYFQISSPDNSIFTWELYAMSGEKIKAGRAINTQDLWLNDVPVGIYMVKVRGNSGCVNQKVVKVQ